MYYAENDRKDRIDEETKSEVGSTEEQNTVQRWEKDTPDLIEEEIEEIVGSLVKYEVLLH